MYNYSLLEKISFSVGWSLWWAREFFYWFEKEEEETCKFSCTIGFIVALFSKMLWILCWYLVLYNRLKPVCWMRKPGMQEKKIWMVRSFSFKFSSSLNLCWMFYLDSERDPFLCFSVHAGEEENGEGADLQQQRFPWDGTDRDYDYEEV